MSAVSAEEEDDNCEGEEKKSSAALDFFSLFLLFLFFSLQNVISYWQRYGIYKVLSTHVVL